MAAKRFFDGGDDQDQPNQKRPKNRFASAIREVVMVNFFENLCSALEPMLRRVVSEEVENELRQRCTTAGGLQPQLPLSRMLCHAQADSRPPATTSLQLTFTNALSLPIFTGTKIVGADGDPLQIVLQESHAEVPTALPYPIKVEIVVLDGDFPVDAGAPWTNTEFDKNIVKERAGKRPLLAGDLIITMRDGIASIASDIEFTDNSSWIRSRKFRIGARVVRPTSGGGSLEPIHSAITDAFMVKDHRGELYKKHHPPALEDQVWRLEKIGKGGAFHQKLTAEGIKTVQDFLKLFHVDCSKLRKILGGGMSEKMWEVTLKHAKECVVGNKLYKLHAGDCTATFNPVCELLRFEANGQFYHHTHMRTTMQTAYIESLVKDAYAKWNTLEVVDGPLHLHTTTPLLLTQEGHEVVEQYPNTEEYVTESGGGEGGNYSADNACIGTFYLSTNTTTTANVPHPHPHPHPHHHPPKYGIRIFSECLSSSDVDGDGPDHYIP